MGLEILMLECYKLHSGSDCRGGGGIRTHETLETFGASLVRCIRPLCHTTCDEGPESSGPFLLPHCHIQRKRNLVDDTSTGERAKNDKGVEFFLASLADIPYKEGNLLGVTPCALRSRSLKIA